MADSWSRYLVWMAAALFATIALFAAMNLAIDPLGIFGSPRLSGINAIKPYRDHHRELTRWLAARRLCPSAGIFGNSRAEIGFDPEHPAFRALGLEAFNHAIPGSSLVLGYSQLLWLKEARCSPRLVIAGVEFFDFLGASAAKSATAPSPKPTPRIDARVLAETVFSLTGFRDSITTLSIQRAQYPAMISAKGFNPLLHYIPEAERYGYYPLFRQRAEDNFKNWSRKEPRIQPAHGGISSDYLELEAFLSAATRRGTNIHLVIYPYHAQIRLMMERLGLGKLFTQWKASIVTTARKFANSGATVTVWDFSGLSAETREAIPASGDRHTQMQYYWEGGHFKKVLGDRVLARILDAKPGFGVQLQEPMLASWLREDQLQVLEELNAPSTLRADVDSLLPLFSEKATDTRVWRY
jgi:hypothetical protein